MTMPRYMSDATLDSVLKEAQADEAGVKIVDLKRFRKKQLAEMVRDLHTALAQANADLEENKQRIEQLKDVRDHYREISHKARERVNEAEKKMRSRRDLIQAARTILKEVMT